jgi:uncharacterized protein YwgA
MILMDAKNTVKFQKVLSWFKVIKHTPENSYAGRIVIQKLICLMKLMGEDIGYDFRMTVRGPYSKELNEDIFKYLIE